MKHEIRKNEVMMTLGEIEDEVVAKYEPLKEDFKILWDERNEYYSFENWWSDLLKWRIDTHPNNKTRP